MARKESRRNTIKPKGSIVRIGHKSHVKWEHMLKNHTITDKLSKQVEKLEKELCKK